ncbi:phosphotransferase [Ilumatobacter sp.]|uniref:phosphotransferase n=1 Tax=Ilumatobacter sp. TaxID=1967498 RepID=UPI003C5FFDBC
MGAPTPTTLEGFTPAWLTDELRRSGTIGPDSTVTAVDQTILGEGEGFMGVLARLALSYDGPVGPATMIAKIPTPVDRNRAAGRAIGVYEREVRVYSDILPAIDIPKPKVYSAIYEADGHEPKMRAQTIKVDRFPLWLLRRLIMREQGKSFVPPCVMLIEDLADGEIGDQVAGASPERAAAALSVFARLHAATWGAVSVPDVHWTKGPDTIPRLVHALYLNGREKFLDAAAPYFSPHSVALYESLSATGVERVKRQRVEVPQCLLHGDARLDNMFFGPDGSVGALIDWQTATPGPVVVDVAYFMMSSLQHDVPESVVDELLAGYHAELVANGVNDYPFDRFLADYLDATLIVLHRSTGLIEAADLGDGRGVELMEKWLRRIDARLQRVAPQPSPVGSGRVRQFIGRSRHPASSTSGA